AVAIAVGRCELGVDIEMHRPLQAMQALVERVFHRDEQRWLAEQSDLESAFFRLWTLKEALLKAAGTGFSHPPEQLCWRWLDDETGAAAWFLGRRWTGFSHAIGEATLSVALPADAVRSRPRYWRVERDTRSAPLVDTGFHLMPDLAG